MQRQNRNEASVLCWKCNEIVHVQQSIGVLREKLGIREMRCSVQERKLCWFGHVMSMDARSCIQKC